MSSSISVDLSKNSSNVHSCCLLKYLPDGMIDRVEAWAFLRMSLFEDDKFARRQGLGLESLAFSISIVVELWALGSGRCRCGIRQQEGTNREGGFPELLHKKKVTMPSVRTIKMGHFLLPQTSRYLSIDLIKVQ